MIVHRDLKPASIQLYRPVDDEEAAQSHSTSPAGSYSRIGECRKSRENGSFQAWAQGTDGSNPAALNQTIENLALDMCVLTERVARAEGRLARTRRQIQLILIVIVLGLSLVSGLFLLIRT
jgi:hypothetical protein